MRVASFDGKSKIVAELDVVKEIEKGRVIVHLFAEFYKELTYQSEDDYWKVTKEDIDASTINNRQTKRGSSSRARAVKRRTKSIH